MEDKNKKLVIFDFDGVLADTLNVCFDLHKKANTDFTWDKFRDFSNGNFVKTITDAENNGHVIVDDFYERYGEGIIKLNFSKILHNMITNLSSDYILIIISSTPSSYINKFVKKQNIDVYFADVLGREVNDSKVIKINDSLKKYNISSDNAVFITDSLGDILEANKCNVKSIGVTWGIHPKETLKKGNPAVIIDDPRKLLGEIKNVLK